MVDRSVARAKIAVIQIKLRELRERSGVTVEQLSTNIAIQSIFLHSYQVALQACCDLASHIIADQELGIPGSSAELFEILSSAKIIPQPLARRFKDHVGLRNLIVHGYDKLDYAKLRKEMPPRIQDISRYLKAIISYAKL